MKKILTALILVASLSIFSCSTGNITTSDNSNQWVKLKQSPGQEFVVEVRKGEKGGDISVKFYFPEESFSAKASTSGTRPKRPQDITHCRLYLTTSGSDPLKVTDLKFMSAVLPYPGTTTPGALRRFTLSNVPQGGPYFAAVELFDNVAAGQANNLIQPVVYGGTTGTRGIAVSSGPVAAVTVDVVNAIHDTIDNTLTIFPILRSGIGASIDTTVTPDAGNNTNGRIGIN